MLNRITVAMIIAGSLLVAAGCARKQKVVEPATTQLSAPSTSAVQPAYASSTQRSQAAYSK